MHRLVLLILAVCSTASAASTTGIPSVIDGDTLDIRGERFRLQGVDAPESSQTCVKAGRTYGCGRETANLLAAKVRNKSVRCEHIERDRYGRTVARCYLGAEDLNRWLVRSGLAVAYEEYDRTYVPDETYAKANKLGLWAGSFQDPAEYRRNPRNPATAGTPRAPTVTAPRGGAQPATPTPGASFRNCTEVRAAGRAPIRRSEPGFEAKFDRDGDGVGCE